MSNPKPATSASSADAASAPAPAASSVFVTNDTLRPITLVYFEDTEHEGRQQRKAILGPGCNVVPAPAGKTLEVGDPFGGIVRVEDPTKLPPHIAGKLAHDTSSRQAVRLWRAAETRPQVLKALDERLAQRGPRKTDDESNLDS